MRSSSVQKDVEHIVRRFTGKIKSSWKNSIIFFFSHFSSTLIILISFYMSHYHSMKWCLFPFVYTCSQNRIVVSWIISKNDGWRAKEREEEEEDEATEAREKKNVIFVFFI
jgi:uncharacterized membrane protein YesL